VAAVTGSRSSLQQAGRSERAFPGIGFKVVADLLKDTDARLDLLDRSLAQEIGFTNMVYRSLQQMNGVHGRLHGGFRVATS